MRKAMAAARRKITPAQRLTAPIVTGKLRRSMTTRIEPNRNRIKVTFRTVYARWVDIKSKKNSKYLARGAKKAVIAANKAQSRYRFRFNGRVNYSASGKKGHIHCYLNYRRIE